MRIALVGAGGMGTCHYMNYRHIEGAQVVALVGRGERDRAHAEQWGLPLYTCVDEANRREQIDLFDVCVPTYLHKAIVLEALACGVPVLTTLHAATAREVCLRAGVKGLLADGVFEQVIFVRERRAACVLPAAEVLKQGCCGQ